MTVQLTVYGVAQRRTPTRLDAAFIGSRGHLATSRRPLIRKRSLVQVRVGHLRFRRSASVYVL